MGGKMGGNTFKAPEERGRPRFLVIWLLAGFMAVGGTPAHPQEQPASCAPAIARVVSLQGTVEVQRVGSADWLGVDRLDTSICAGDRLRTAPSSRAALFVQPETLVRVDQNTTITLQQSTDEISVEFSTDEPSQVACNAQSCGAGYFIARFPKRFRVTTPHLNAAVEGTEFMVELSVEASQVTVLEGQVRSQVAATQESRSLTPGQQLTAGPGTPTAFSTVIKPADAVQWVLRYPPLSDADETGYEAGLARAEAWLQVGRVDEALQEIKAALDSNAGDANALALRSVVQLAKNDKAAAMESARAATVAAPGNYRAWLALSYAEQASFELEAALASAKSAQGLQAGSSLVHARVAELELSLGNLEAAERAGRAAVSANPSESSGHAILGFVHLAEIDTEAARSSFNTAIERDSFNAMPRLGMGLAMIRDGRLAQGREQIEIAVALDPGNSLLRSYVGKAYYEENTGERNDLAATQFVAGMSLDPSDPTPHLYDAIRLQTTNRPVEALHAIRESVRRNDNRAVYRSELRLDEDLAVRGASQGRIYRDLGFEDLAVLEGWKSVDGDPGDFSGHRLLADTYAGIPEHEIARVNELYTSQLLQPLNLTPVPPQLGEANLFVLDTAGPSDIAFNEFNPLFARNRAAIQASATVGGNNTWGNDFSVAAIRNRWSLSLGQFHFETDGFRANNDLKQDVYNAFAQFRQTGSTSWTGEIRAARREQGDLRLLFDSANFNPTERQTEDTDSARIGVHHAFNARSELLASLAYQNAEYSIRDLPLFELDGEVDSYAGEVQYLFRGERWRWISGLRQTHREQSEASVLTIPLPFPPFEERFAQASEFTFDNTSVYGYAYYDPADSLTLSLGASYDKVETDTVDREQLNPKLGLAWEPSERTRIRVAALRSVQPDSYSRQDIPPRLEPTQVAGFNQAFFGDRGEREWRYGLGLDHEVSPDLHLGAELVWRDIDIPVLFAGSDDVAVVRDFDSEGLAARAYLHWTPGSRWAASASYRYDERSYESFARAIVGIEGLRTHRVPMSVRYFHPAGFSADLTATWVDQEGEFFSLLFEPPFEQITRGADRFCVVDAAIRYRLPRRMGIVSVTASNVLDEEFQFQDVDPMNPEIVPERLVSLKLTIAF